MNLYLILRLYYSLKVFYFFLNMYFKLFSKTQFINFRDITLKSTLRNISNMNTSLQFKKATLVFS